MSATSAVIPSRDERFIGKVRVEGDHWLWEGATSKGRPQIRDGGKTINAYVAAWEMEHGPLPPDHYVSHRCPDKLPECVKPDHQEAVAYSSRGGKGGPRLGDKRGPYRSRRKRETANAVS
jgi:hypothetical protein